MSFCLFMRTNAWTLAPFLIYSMSLIVKRSNSRAWLIRNRTISIQNFASHWISLWWLLGCGLSTKHEPSSFCLLISNWHIIKCSSFHFPVTVKNDVPLHPWNNNANFTKKLKIRKFFIAKIWVSIRHSRLLREDKDICSSVHCKATSIMGISVNQLTNKTYFTFEFCAGTFPNYSLNA